MTLKSLLETDLEDVFFVTTDHAETVVYYPKSGPPVSVIAICDLDQGMPDEQRGIVEHQILAVLCSRDDTNTTTRGIKSPQIGDRIKRTVDGVEEEYSFSGEVQDADEFAWTLLFNRFDPFRMGGNHVR